MKRTAYLTALLLTGCAAPGYWTHPHGDAAQFERDKARCDYEVRRSDPIMAPSIYFDIMGRCLKAQGYEWRAGEMPKS